MANRWNLGLGGTIGGFGVSDTHLTWPADLSVAYCFCMGDVPGAVSLGFRAQGLNFETGSEANHLKGTRSSAGRCWASACSSKKPRSLRIPARTHCMPAVEARGESQCDKARIARVVVPTITQ
jgi:hypothetical protein